MIEFQHEVVAAVRSLRQADGKPGLAGQALRHGDVGERRVMVVARLIAGGERLLPGGDGVRVAGGFRQPVAKSAQQLGDFGFERLPVRVRRRPPARPMMKCTRTRSPSGKKG